MHRIIAGGTGLIGQHLVEHWLTQGARITVIGRCKEKIQRLFANKVTAIEWLTLEPQFFHQAQVVVNLTGAGIADHRWSTARKQEIISSRLQATQKLASLLGRLSSKAPPLFNASAIGIYGLQQATLQGLPAALDEATVIDWHQAPDFLAYVGREWEKATHLINKTIRVVNLRFGVVLAKSGGALPKIVAPFHFYLGGKIGNGRQPFSWIAITDLIAAIDFLLTQPSLTGPVNIVAPECITQQQLAAVIAKLLHKPHGFKMPAIVIKLLFGQMGQELLLAGQHAYPQRLMAAGFHFSYPTIEAALLPLLSPTS